MSQHIQDSKELMQKVGIKQLNQMQKNASKAIRSNDEVVILSPTGTGKTLAFALPVIAELDPTVSGIQALVLVPSRELAIQIEQVIRALGSGFKVNVVYGGRAGTKDKQDLKHAPSILVGTPGRVSDLIKREIVDTSSVKHLILDEFDKSLEVGFAKEMKAIIETLGSLKKKVLTSATAIEQMPEFIALKAPKELNYLGETSHRLSIKVIETPREVRLKTLVNLLAKLDGNGIIFCTYKNTISIISEAFAEQGIDHACFYGGMEQQDRERALIKFRNGTHRILLATDLAARGIDVPELNFIVHYELTLKGEEFTHRNGRTARMNSEGSAYIMKSEVKNLPAYVGEHEYLTIEDSNRRVAPSKWRTLFISGGRKDKISKGDIAGLFIKQGKLTNEQLGHIELKTDCAFVAVASNEADRLIDELNNSRLKKKKVRIREL